MKKIYTVMGVVCPKNWNTIGKNGKKFTIVINQDDLQETQAIKMFDDPFEIIKVGATVSNGTKYTVIHMFGQEGGFKVSEFKNYDLQEWTEEEVDNFANDDEFTVEEDEIVETMLDQMPIRDSDDKEQKEALSKIEKIKRFFGFGHK